MKAVITPKYTSPAPTGGVTRSVRTAQILGKSTDQALNRRMKLDDALGKFRSAAGGKK